MELKWTITAGELLQIITILLGLFGIYNRLSIQITKVEARLDPIVKWWECQIERASVRDWKNEHGGD
jgi:hypothetical protein